MPSAPECKGEERNIIIKLSDSVASNHRKPTALGGCYSCRVAVTIRQPALCSFPFACFGAALKEGDVLYLGPALGSTDFPVPVIYDECAPLHFLLLHYHSPNLDVKYTVSVCPLCAPVPS